MNTQNKSFEVGFVGIGQGGCKIAHAFARLGYEAIYLNTAKIDLDALDAGIERKLIVGSSSDGAGKQPEVAEKAIADSEDMIELMMEEFFGKVDRLIVCAGAGGGTGTGGAIPLLRLSKRFMAEGRKKPDSVGLIITSPRKLECSSTIVKKNAKDLLQSVCKMCGDGEISPLMILNNRRIKNVIPKATMKSMWGLANDHVAGLFHEFNTITQTPSDFECMDKSDLETIMLRPGCLSFGKVSINADCSAQSIKNCVFQLFSSTLFSHSESDVSQQSFGIVIKVPTQVFETNEVFFENLESGLQMVLTQLRGGYLHKGIYEDPTIPDPVIYCISRGIKGPEKKVIQEL